MGCRNTIGYNVPHGNFNYRVVMVKCGTTDPHGGVAMCGDCGAEANRRYPQGWRNVPGDVCRHGTYIGDQWGHDYLCGACENGDD